VEEFVLLFFVFDSVLFFYCIFQHWHFCCYLQLQKKGVGCGLMEQRKRTIGGTRLKRGGGGGGGGGGVMRLVKGGEGVMGRVKGRRRCDETHVIKGKGFGERDAKVLQKIRRLHTGSDFAETKIFGPD
jgi:hypothetical protein